MVSCRSGRCFSSPRSGPRTEQACPCHSPKEWYRASCSGGIAKISVQCCGCCSITTVPNQCDCCWSVPCSGPKTEQACTCPSPNGWCRVGSGRGMGTWCRVFVGLCECCSLALASCRGGCCCSIPSSGPKTERACTCPSPKEWCRAGLVGSMGSCRGLVVRPFWCCSLCLVAWVVSCPDVGGLCLPKMWIMRVVSSLPPLRPALSMSSYRLSACLRVGILNFAGVCARGDFCDVFGAEAGCLPVVAAPRRCVASCAGVRI